MSATITLPPASRLQALPKYVFARLEELKAQAVAKGADLIDLGMGNPDQPTPQPIVQAAMDAAGNPENHRYPTFGGKKAYRQAACDWMARRYNVLGLDPDTQAQALIGSKEGIAHLSMAFADEDAVNIVWSPHYPVHARANLIAAGHIHNVVMNEANNYLPDPETIPKAVVAKTRLLIISYPHNPTTAIAPRAYLEKMVAFCRKHQIVLISDLAYGEIYYDDADKPVSILEIPGAMDVAIEFHSCSKSFNMAGFRAGFAVGNPEIISHLYNVKTNCDYGLAGFIQDAATVALNRAEDFLPDICTTYRERRDVWVAGINKMGWNIELPKATLYVWMPIPQDYENATVFCEDVLAKTGVVLTPGSAFGQHGEGYVRTALVAPKERLQEGLDRMAAANIRFS